MTTVTIEFEEQENSVHFITAIKSMIESSSFKPKNVTMVIKEEFN